MIAASLACYLWGVWMVWTWEQGWAAWVGWGYALAGWAGLMYEVMR
jgi:hypothetical protein